MRKEFNDEWYHFLERRQYLKDIIFQQLTFILNEIHQVNYSEKFWKIILDPYVKTMLNDRNKIQNPIKDFLIPQETCANTLLPNKNLVRYSYLIQMLKSCLSAPRKSSIYKSIKAHDIILTGFHDSYSTPNVSDCYIKPYYNFIPHIKTNLSMRAPVDHLVKGGDEELTAHFWNNSIQCMPKVYLEDFKRIYDSIPLIDPQNKTFHISMLETTYMRMLIAKYVENGSQLVYYQHGGFYGEYDYHSGHWYESSIANKFMTWGWKYLPNDTPDYAYRLNFFFKKFKEIYKQQFKFDLLLVFPTIEAKSEIPGETKEFFADIDRVKFKNICLRPRPTSKFDRKGPLVTFKGKGVHVDSGYGKPVSLIATSKLVVQFKYPSTNFFECLSVDHPTVALLKNDVPSEIIKHHYDYLLSVGVFHLDIASLVRHLNTVNLPQWWATVIASPEYMAFKREFLNLKTD